MSQKLLNKKSFTSNQSAQALIDIMLAKKSNLAVSVDLTNAEAILNLVEKVGPHVCMVKTHVDIIEDYTPNFAEQLQLLANKHQFSIFEDRKFADIGNTVRLQYEKGIYHIADWADIINAHPLPGEGIIQGLSAVGKDKGRALLLLAEMSSAGNLFTDEYRAQTVALAHKHKEFVIGFITRQALTDGEQFLNLTPGINIADAGDGLGQQYLTPAQAIARGTDIIIVGRGIIKADDPASVAKQYQQQGWESYTAV